MFAVVGLLFLVIFIGSILGFAAFTRVRGLEDKIGQLEKTHALLLRRLEQSDGEVGEGRVDPTDEADDQAQTAGNADDEPEETPKAAADGETPEPTDDEGEAPKELPIAAKTAASAGYKPFNADEPSQPDKAPQPEAARQPAKGKIDLETAIGTRWSVLLGGLMLALGVIFLARYSIEAGLLGPGPRLLIGALVSTALLAGGEWLRRRDIGFELPSIPYADIPSILTSAGVIGAFAVLFAAHALYGFIGPALAFVLLTLVGLAALALSLVHGPILAALGLLGAYATPALVSSSEPNLIALALHTLIVTAAVLALGRWRNWLGVSIGGVAGSLIWVLIMALSAQSTDVAIFVMLIGLAAIFITRFAMETDFEPEITQALTVIAFAGLVGVAGFNLLQNFDKGAYWLTLILALMLMAAAIMRPVFIHAAPMVAAMIILAVARINDVVQPSDVVTYTGYLMRSILPENLIAFLTDIAILSLPPLALAAFGALRAGSARRKDAGWLAGSAVGIGFFVLIVTYLRVAPFETQMQLGIVGLVLAAAYAMLAELSVKRDPDDPDAPAPTAFAIGAIAALCFAVGVLFDKSWLPIAFALCTAGIVFVHSARRLFILPWLAAAATIFSVIAIGVQLPDQLERVSTVPIFNGLILMPGLPALLMLASGEILRRRDEYISLVPIGFGMAFGDLFVALELIHWINGGSFEFYRQSLSETAAHAIAALLMTAGLRVVARKTGALIYDWGFVAVGVLSVVINGWGLIALFNPLFTREFVGNGAVFNLLLPGYLLTALAAASVAWMLRDHAQRWYAKTYAWLAGILGFLYFSLMLRKAFQGGYLNISRDTSDLEVWSYSVLWLIMGGFVLAAGIRYRSLTLRAASGIIIGLTVAKVFLLDMSALTGVMRAASFIGLGLSLIGIGRFYQRLLGFGKSEAEPETESEEEPQS